MKSVLFFESHSLLQVFWLVRRIRRVTHVYFGGSTFIADKALPRHARLVVAFVRLLNPRAVVDTVPEEITRPHAWTLNRDGAGLIRDKQQVILDSAPYRLLDGLLRDGRLVRFFSGFLSARIPSWSLFEKAAVDLEEKAEAFLAVPGGRPFVEPEGAEVKTPTPVGVKTINCMRYVLRNAMLAVVALILPTGFLFSRFRQGFGVKDRRRFKLAMPVIWGVNNTAGLVDGIKKHTDDTYLYGEGLAPGDIVHVFGGWDIAADLVREYENNLSARGLPHRYKSRYRLTFGMVVTCLRIQAQICRRLPTLLGCIKGDRLMFVLLCGLLKGLYYYLLKQLEWQNIAYDVELVKNDYDPGHVINVIVNSRHGARSVAVQHTASPYDLPQLCFACPDSYMVYGEIYTRLFGDFWSGLKLERTGRESLDWLMNLSRNEVRVRDLSERFAQAIPKRAHTLLLLLPGVGPGIAASRWQELYQGLKDLREVALDVSVILRFRREADLRALKTEFDFAKLAAADPRITIESTRFTTHELYLVSDAVIATSASFGINEVAALGKKIFTFEMMGTGRLYFGDYGSDFILRGREDLVRVMRGLPGGFAGFDCHWERLARDCNYHADGRNIERMRRVILGVPQGTGLTKAA